MQSATNTNSFNGSWMPVFFELPVSKCFTCSSLGPEYHSSFGWADFWVRSSRLVSEVNDFFFYHC